jgi:glutathione S-transferase
MLTVHHLENSRSQRVLWLLEELAVPYEIERYKREPDLRAPEALKAVHPLGKSPVVTDGTRTIAESGAVIEYILETYGESRLVPPPASEDRLRFTYWLHYAEGSAQPLLYFRLIFNNLDKRVPPQAAEGARAIGEAMNASFVMPQLEAHMDYWDAELARTGWFAGPDFTAADIQMSYPLESAAARVGLDARRPNAMRFLEAIRERPAYKRALEKGGPFRLAR